LLLLYYCFSLRFRLFIRLRRRRRQFAFCHFAFFHFHCDISPIFISLIIHFRRRHFAAFAIAIFDISHAFIFAMLSLLHFISSSFISSSSLIFHCCFSFIRFDILLILLLPLAAIISPHYCDIDITILFHFIASFLIRLPAFILIFRDFLHFFSFRHYCRFSSLFHAFDISLLLMLSRLSLFSLTLSLSFAFHFAISLFHISFRR